ncbi:tannase [Seiridium cupressi]
MKFWLPFTVVGGAAAIASLSAVCTTEYIQSVLPSLSDIPSGITINSDSVTVVPYDNYSVTDATFWNDVVGGVCEMAFLYGYQNQDDQILVEYYLPSPETF